MGGVIGDLDHRPAISSLRAAFTGRCPRCGQGAMFKDLIGLQPACSHCGLALADYDQGDGPAVFGTFFIGALVVAGALLLEFTAAPPIWVHAVVWLPVILLLTLAFLRVLKGFLVAQHFRHQAEEARLDDSFDDPDAPGR
jgi:uncharacterized protein (DUF983 family)